LARITILAFFARYWRGVPRFVVAGDILVSVDLIVQLVAARRNRVRKLFLEK
jgi:hypothetical protein